MKFVLTIEMGNAAMQSYRDLRAAVHDAAEAVVPSPGMEGAHPTTGTDAHGSIRDVNGNTVGKWELG